MCHCESRSAEPVVRKGLVLDIVDLPGLPDVAGMFQYNRMHAAHGSSQVGKAALVGWHAMVVMITDRRHWIWCSLFNVGVPISASFISFVTQNHSASVLS